MIDLERIVTKKKKTSLLDSLFGMNFMNYCYFFALKYYFINMLRFNHQCLSILNVNPINR